MQGALGDNNSVIELGISSA